MTWAINFIINCANGQSFFPTDEQEKELVNEKDPVAYLQKISQAQGLKFQSLTIELKKSGLINPKDLRKLTKLAKIMGDVARA